MILVIDDGRVADVHLGRELLEDVVHGALALSVGAGVRLIGGTVGRGGGGGGGGRPEEQAQLAERVVQVGAGARGRVIRSRRRVVVICRRSVQILVHAVDQRVEHSGARPLRGRAHKSAATAQKQTFSSKENRSS